jgi:cytochrome P450
MGKLPPGPRTPSLINGIRFARDPLTYVRSFYRRYGPVSKSRFPGLGLMVYVAAPELVKQVFAGEPSVFHAGEANASVLEPAVGLNSVLTLDEEEHLRQRKLLLPPFHGDNIKRWGEAIRAITESDIESWPVGTPFVLRMHTQRITLDVILRAVFGVRDEERFRRAQVLVDEFARRAHPVVLFGFMRHDLGRWSPWARFNRARIAVDEFLYEEIALRREERDTEERDDVLSLLLRATDEDGHPMTDRELRDELVTVIGAGHETTATALAWAFERLLRNSRVMDRLKRSLPEGDDYLDATIKETLRIRPVIADAARRVTREIELGGYRIPAGAVVMPAITALHFREDIYPEPDEFRPERFLEGAPDSYSWIPFGGGVRRCIGASFAQFEMRVVMRTILEHTELRAADPAPERPRIRNITTAPAKGCRVVMQRRLLRPTRAETLVRNGNRPTGITHARAGPASPGRNGQSLPIADRRGRGWVTQGHPSNVPCAGARA